MLGKKFDSNEKVDFGEKLVEKQFEQIKRRDRAMSTSTARPRPSRRMDSPSTIASSPRKHAAHKKILKLTKMITDQQPKKRVKSVETETRSEVQGNSQSEMRSRFKQECAAMMKKKEFGE